MNKKTKTTILSEDHFFSSLKNKHLLLDTSFFFDAVKNEADFFELKESCQQSGITLVTIDPVGWEFTRGTSGTELKDRLAFLDIYIQDNFLPFNSPDINQIHIPFLIEKYQKSGSSISVTDLLLGALAKKHKDLCVLTKNPKDFPLSVFNLETYLLLKGHNFLQVYGAYSFIEKNKKRVNKDEEIVPF